MRPESRRGSIAGLVSQLSPACGIRHAATRPMIVGASHFIICGRNHAGWHWLLATSAAQPRDTSRRSRKLLSLRDSDCEQSVPPRVKRHTSQSASVDLIPVQTESSMRRPFHSSRNRIQESVQIVARNQRAVHIFQTYQECLARATDLPRSSHLTRDGSGNSAWQH
jgi:hypothetical protein